MPETMIQSLRDYFRNCPYMTDNKITVDFLPETEVEVTVSATPVVEISKRYADGSSVRGYPFFIRSKQEYEEDILQQLADGGFFESLSDWLDEQSKKGALPLLPAGKTPQKLEALQTGYRFTQESATTGQFEVQCRLYYFQEG